MSGPLKIEQDLSPDWILDPNRLVLCRGMWESTTGWLCVLRHMRLTYLDERGGRLILSEH